MVEVYDRGKEKGAAIVRQTILSDEIDGSPIATILRTVLARGDGGLGGSQEKGPLPHQTPDREPDRVVEYQTSGNQAGIYRLSGDRNPLHIDPDLARAAGFSSPILHGLCTYGYACRAVLQAFCEFDPARIVSHQARFSSPVFPGDKLTIKLWREDETTISFEVDVAERNVTVIRNGLTILR